MVLAVLQQHCRLRLHNQDVFASTVGGARLSEPATDLAIAIAWPRPTTGVPPRRASSRSARSAWPASCAGSATCRSGWPRRPGSASSSRWSPAEPRRAQLAASVDVDGLRVIDVPDIGSALRPLGFDAPDPDGARTSVAR